MNDGHSSDLSHAVHVQCMTMPLTQDERDKAHSSVRVDVLRVEDSHGCHVVIGVGIVHRHHASITYQLLNSHF